MINIKVDTYLNHISWLGIFLCLISWGFFSVRLLQDQLKKWHEMIMPVEAVMSNRLNGKSPSTTVWVESIIIPGMGFLKFPAAAGGNFEGLTKSKGAFFNKTIFRLLYKGSRCAAFPFHSTKCEWIDSLTSYPCHMPYKQSTWDSIWWLFFKCSQQFALGHVSFGKLLRLKCLPSCELTYPIQRCFWRWFFFSSCGIC